jgi:putative ABC transport system permease protein
VLRIVGALADSVFQSELLVSDAQFVRLFPRQEGFRFFLIDVDAPRQAAVTALLEDRLGDLGLDVQGTVDRIEAYHRVERTYLSTFQTLGAFGLILGTLGLGAVLLRNVLERRRELALLRVVGYRAAHLRAMVLAESLLLLGAGVAGGTLAAVLAVAPALWERGGGPPWLHTAVLLVCVLAAGIVSSVAAARAATRSTLLAALRSE